jgi:RimJ/RimL family protein N-acetyltransferase
MNDFDERRFYASEASSERNIVITGDTVTVRLITRSDVDRMVGWAKFSEPDLQWANFTPRSESEKDWWYWSNTKDSTVLRFVIVPHIPVNPYATETQPLAEPEPIGLLGLRHIDYKRGEATLGIRMSANTVGQGYGTAAIMTLLDYCFNEMKLRRVLLDVDERNTRARRCYDKCGYRIIGYHRSFDGCNMIDMEVDQPLYLAAKARLAARNRENGQNGTPSD